jgi:hypothetical protein
MQERLLEGAATREYEKDGAAERRVSGLLPPELNERGAIRCLEELRHEATGPGQHNAQVAREEGLALASAEGRRAQ